ncbi:MAG: tRNA epoxyqueuosine(34) reductase QueG [Phycisphaerales bacterium JB039]
MKGPRELQKQVLRRCGELGFALGGVTEAKPSQWAAELTAWLADGRHGTMGYLARNVQERLDVRRLLPGARSVVMVADQYATRNDPPEAPAPAGQGRIARYARGRDYHREIKRRLHLICDELRAQHGAECRAFTDTAPVLERELAARAGLGWIGKHTLLIHPRLGSYTLLGGFVTTLDLIGSDPEARPDPVADACGSCTRCIDACPTDAISPYSVDASRCISYLTIERRAPLPEGAIDALAGWLFGCDICQEVCPHNSPRPRGADIGEANRAYRPGPGRGGTIDLRALLGWEAEDRSRELAGSAMKRATLAMLKRNAIALLAEPGGAGDPGLVRWLAQREDDEAEDPGVRAAARDARRRLAPDPEPPLAEPSRQADRKPRR